MKIGDVWISRESHDLIVVIGFAHPLSYPLSSDMKIICGRLCASDMMGGYVYAACDLLYSTSGEISIDFDLLVESDELRAADAANRGKDFIDLSLAAYELGGFQPLKHDEQVYCPDRSSLFEGEVGL